MNTPILFLIFNRPELTAVVFEKIRQQKPTKLYVAADGPRNDKESEDKKCETTRQIVIDGVDWDCEVQTLFRNENLGCGKAVHQAITWFFDHEEEGIILEDDCLPNDSFFSYCADMLNRYRNDSVIMMISGTSYQPEPLNLNSYYFSKYVHVWAWATWRRAWQLYSFNLKDFNEVECIEMLKTTFNTKRERKMWLNNFNHILNGFDTWDYQWMYCIWKNNGITAIPWQNMISNIGFGSDATHTFSEDSNQAKMQQFDLTNIIHPKNILLNSKADRIERYNILITPPFSHYKQKSLHIVKKVIKFLTGYK